MSGLLTKPLFSARTNDSIMRPKWNHWCRKLKISSVVIGFFGLVSAFHSLALYRVVMAKKHIEKWLNVFSV